MNSDLDLNGYYMAELDGRKGLVSSLYIEEIDEYDMRKLRKVCSTPWFASNERERVDASRTIKRELQFSSISSRLRA